MTVAPQTCRSVGLAGGDLCCAELFGFQELLQRVLAFRAFELRQVLAFGVGSMCSLAAIEKCIRDGRVPADSTPGQLLQP